MKKAEKFEVGKQIAANSDGRIRLSIEDSVAVLSGEFTKAERKPLRFKKGAGWRYKVVDGVETWSLNVARIAESIEPIDETPKTALSYVVEIHDIDGDWLLVGFNDDEDIAAKIVCMAMRDVEAGEHHGRPVDAYRVRMADTSKWSMD